MMENQLITILHDLMRANDVFKAGTQAPRDTHKIAMAIAREAQELAKHAGRSLEQA